MNQAIRDTSIDAFRQVQLLLPARRVEAFNFLWDLGKEGTSGEVMEYAKKVKPELSQTYLNNIDKRLSELRDMDVIEENGTIQVIPKELTERHEDIPSLAELIERALKS